MIELRAITHSAVASQETHFYRASLWVDGERWGDVGNDGHGGADFFHGVGGKTYDDLNGLEARIKLTFPASDVSYIYGDEVPAGTHMQPPSLEVICCDLVNDFLAARDLTRSLKTRFLFIKPGQSGVFEIPLKQKGRTFTWEVVRAAVEPKQPGIVILNALPFAEALAIRRAQEA